MSEETSFDKYHRERSAADRRLCILRLMMDDPAYQTNLYVTHDALKAVGHPVSRDLLVTDCGWLEKQGLLEISDLAGVIVIKLTQRGFDVAQGYAVVSGIKRPMPE